MRLRSGWPLAVLILLLVLIPIGEVYLLIQVGQEIGPWPTVGILIAEAVLGGWLMRREGARAWKALNDTFTGGKVPTGELANAALILVGGILLMVPGFLTDVLGLIFLIPWTRPLARKAIAFFLARRMSRMGLDTVRARMDSGNVVPGEVVDPPPSPRSGPIVITGEIEDPPHRP